MSGTGFLEETLALAQNRNSFGGHSFQNVKFVSVDPTIQRRAEARGDCRADT